MSEIILKMDLGFCQERQFFYPEQLYPNTYEVHSKCLPKKMRRELGKYRISWRLGFGIIRAKCLALLLRNCRIAARFLAS